MKKQILLSTILSVSMVFAAVSAAAPCHASDKIQSQKTACPQSDEICPMQAQPSEEELAKDDPGYFRLSGQADKNEPAAINKKKKAAPNTIVLEPADTSKKNSSSVSPYTGLTYTHADAFDGMNIYHGVDVSYYQKTIDWAKVKAAGIDYAFIRMGYRGYSSGALATDTMFTANMQGAIAAGIKVGVYFFSLAVDASEAMQEATYVADAIKSYQITMPVAIDWEYLGNKENDPRYTSGTSTATNTTVCTVFCDVIKSYGYTPMIYANKNDLTNHLDGKTLGEKYEVWLARYNTTAEYTNNYTFWQYSSSGSVDGISGKTDMNFWYTTGSIDNPVFAHGSTAAAVSASPEPTEEPDEVADIKHFTADSYKKSILLSWDEVEDVSGYEIYRKDNYNGSFRKIKTISDSEETSWENTKLSANHEYYYKLRAYIKVSSGKIYSDYVKITAATKTKAQVGIAKRTLKILRKPAKNSGTLLTVRSGIPLEAAGITYLKNGKKFLHVKYYTKSKIYNGYLPANTALRYYSQKTTTATLNLRRTAGMKGKLLTSIPKGTPLPMMGKKKVSGTTWRKTVYSNKKGKLLTGYAAGTYLK